MSLSCGFFNSVNGDRTYAADEFASMFDGLIVDGIFSTIGRHFAVRPVGDGTSTLQVVIGSGKAWFKHIWIVNDSDIVVNIPDKPITGSRIDAVTFKIDKTDQVRNVTIEVIEGNVASTAERPVIPADDDDNGIYYRVLAYISVDASTTYIQASNIDNVVGDETPFASGIIQQTAIGNTVAVPNVSTGNLVWNKTSQSPTIDTYDPNIISVRGNSEINAGTHHVTFSLIDTNNYIWDDYTTADKQVPWTIKKAQGSIRLNKNSISLNHENQSVTVRIMVLDSDGDITVASSDESIATVTINSGPYAYYEDPTRNPVYGSKSGDFTIYDIKISSVNRTAGNAIITVSLSGTSNSNAPEQVSTISVTADFVKIVSWANGTDQEIADMIEAAYKGEIDLSEYWNVGDARTITRSAIEEVSYTNNNITNTYPAVPASTTDKVIILDFNPRGYVYYDGSDHFIENSTYTTALLSIGFVTSSGAPINTGPVYCGSQGYWTSNNGTAASLSHWEYEDYFYNAIDSNFRKLLRKFNSPVWYKGYDYASVNWGPYHLVSPESYEIDGDDFGSSDTESTRVSSVIKQFEYFENSAHRILGYTSYWTRTKGGSSDHSRFLNIGASGIKNNDAGSTDSIGIFLIGFI